MKKVWIILAVAGGLVLLAVVAILGFGALFVMTAENLPVTHADEELMVTASDLAPYYDDFDPSGSYEKREKLQYIDGSEELNYEYDSPLDDEPYIMATVSWEKTRSDAKIIFETEWSAQILGMNIADSAMDVEEDNDYYSAGDHSRFGILTYKGNQVGNLFVTQNGNTIYAFAISGFYIEDPDIWHELFDQRIAGLSDL